MRWNWTCRKPWLPPVSFVRSSTTYDIYLTISLFESAIPRLSRGGATQCQLGEDECVALVSVCFLIRGQLLAVSIFFLFAPFFLTCRRCALGPQKSTRETPCSPQVFGVGGLVVSNARTKKKYGRKRAKKKLLSLKKWEKERETRWSYRRDSYRTQFINLYFVSNHSFRPLPFHHVFFFCTHSEKKRRKTKQKRLKVKHVVLF